MYTLTEQQVRDLIREAVIVGFKSQATDILDLTIEINKYVKSTLAALKGEDEKNKNHDTSK